MNTTQTQVAIIGAGPAGLLLSHLLHRSGIDSVVIDTRSRHDIENTIRAGILEQGTVEVLSGTGASDRVLTHGHQHDGIQLKFGDQTHRIDFTELIGRHVWLYPQHEVLRDLIATRVTAGADLRFEVTAEQVITDDAEHPRVLGVDADGNRFQIIADFVVGGDGSRSITRTAVNGSQTNGFFKEYPFAWLGILCEAPPSSNELIYSNSEHGFTLISQRTDRIQRMFLQWDPEIPAESLTETELWQELDRRVPGVSLQQGPIFQRDILRFRSFVAKNLQRDRVSLIGDAAHTVPPTGAKGLNLSVSDVLVLHDGLKQYYETGSLERYHSYEQRALPRIWRAQHFSWWMTTLLHTHPDDSAFDRQRQLGELSSLLSSRAGQTYLAEAYTGWPYAEGARAAAGLSEAEVTESTAARPAGVLV